MFAVRGRKNWQMTQKLLIFIENSLSCMLYRQKFVQTKLFGFFLSQDSFQMLNFSLVRYFNRAALRAVYFAILRLSPNPKSDIVFATKRFFKFCGFKSYLLVTPNFFSVWILTHENFKHQKTYKKMQISHFLQDFLIIYPLRL